MKDITGEHGQGYASLTEKRPFSMNCFKVSVGQMDEI